MSWQRLCFLATLWVGPSSPLEYFSFVVTAHLKRTCFTAVKPHSLAAGTHSPSFPQCSSWGRGQAAGAWDHIQHGYSLEAKVLLSNPLMEVPEAFFNLSHWQKTLASWFRGILLCIAGLCSITLHPALSASEEMNLPFNGGAEGEGGHEAQKIFAQDCMWSL